MCGAQNASESFCIAEIWWDIAVKSHGRNPRNRAEPRYKEGAAREDERPKSREETPKVGYETSAKPNVPHAAIWACSWCSATATIGLRVYFGTHVAHLHRSCTKPRPAGDVRRGRPAGGSASPVVRSWHAVLRSRAPVL